MCAPYRTVTVDGARPRARPPRSPSRACTHRLLLSDAHVREQPQALLLLLRVVKRQHKHALGLRAGEKRAQCRGAVTRGGTAPFVVPPQN